MDDRGDIYRLVAPEPAPAAGEIEECVDQALQLITARKDLLRTGVEFTDR